MHILIKLLLLPDQSLMHTSDGQQQGLAQQRIQPQKRLAGHSF